MRKKKKLYAHILTENINTWMDHLGQLQVKYHVSIILSPQMLGSQGFIQSLHK